MDFGIAGVAAVTVICYLIAQGVKATALDNKWLPVICGVCGGIGEYLNVDPTLIRLVWLLCSLVSCGTGLVVYIAAALIIPEDDGIVG